MDALKYLQLWEVVPDNLKSFYGMLVWSAFFIRKDREHARLIEDCVKMVSYIVRVESFSYQQTK